MGWFLLLAVILIVGFFANVLELGWGLAIIVCIGLAALIVCPVLVIRAKILDIQKEQGIAAVSCKLNAGHNSLYGYKKHFNYSYPDSAGGWDLEIILKNNTEKVINYIELTVTPIDRVGNVAYSSIGNKSTTNIRYTGPLGAYGKKTVYSEDIWYNVALGTVRQDVIVVTFEDGSKQKIYSSGKFINYDKNGEEINK